MTLGEDQARCTWQIGVWDDMADMYVREIDRRFAPIIDHLLSGGPGSNPVNAFSTSARAPDRWPCAARLASRRTVR